MKNFYKNVLSIIRYYHLDKFIVFMSQISPYIIAILYAGVLFYLLLYQKNQLLITIIKPLFAFLFVTIVRKLYNRPRPCITMHIEPLVGHKTGESFPSRHTVSAFSIALAIIPIHIILGEVAFIIDIIVAFTRILCGLHHISDVIAAIVISFIIAFI